MVKKSSEDRPRFLMQDVSQNRLVRLLLLVLSLCLLTGLNSGSPSQDRGSPAPLQERAAKTQASSDAGHVGSDVCITCHEEQNRRFKYTAMGKVMMLNPRNPEEARGCEACHGPGQAHVEAGGGKGTIRIRAPLPDCADTNRQRFKQFRCGTKRGLH